MNYYKRHLGDYARDTAHLSMAEDGAYNRMLDLYYASERPLPADKKDLYRKLRARSKVEQEAVDVCLQDFFSLQDDGYHNTRCDEEIAAMHDKAKTNRANGKGGGRPKKKPKQNPRGNDSGNPEKTHSVSENEGSGFDLETLAIKPLATNPLKNEKHGADAPPVGAWGRGLTVLTEAGMSQPSARSYIAKLLKSWDEGTVADALDEARGTADPKAYAMKILQGKPKLRPPADPFAGAV